MVTRCRSAQAVSDSKDSYSSRAIGVSAYSTSPAWPSSPRPHWPVASPPPLRPDRSPLLPGHWRRDVVAVVLGIGLMAAVYTLVSTADHGFASGHTVVSGAAAVGLLIAFLVREANT